MSKTEKEVIKEFQKELKQKLISTGNSILEEGNYWNDTFWGICKEKEENHLGKLLMKVREECNKERLTEKLLYNTDFFF